MMFAMPIGGHWRNEPQYGTTAAVLCIANRPAINCAADNLYIIGDIQQFVKSWLLSNNRLLEQQIQTPLSASVPRLIAPSQSYADELLDWDDALMERPQRPSGKIKVSLKYAGQARPSPINEMWDDI